MRAMHTIGNALQESNLNRKRTFLFNLQEDVGEKHDLSKDKPEIVAELEKALAEWEARMAEPLLVRPRASDLCLPLLG